MKVDKVGKGTLDCPHIPDISRSLFYQAMTFIIYTQALDHRHLAKPRGNNDSLAHRSGSLSMHIIARLIAAMFCPVQLVFYVKAREMSCIPAQYIDTIGHLWYSRKPLPRSVFKLPSWNFPS